MASMNLKRYYEAASKTDKSMAVAGLVKAVRAACPSGGFLKQDVKSGRFISVGGRETREKVGHCLRDMIASMREDPRRAEEFKTLQSNMVNYAIKKNSQVSKPMDMSEEQKNILQKLESGFEGTVQELLGKS